MSYLSLNPMIITNALRSPSVQPGGYVQGIAPDDPASRLDLSSGTIAITETRSFRGSLPVVELLPGSQSSSRGLTIRRAVSVTELEDFTVLNQAHNGLTTLQSPIPLYASGISVSFCRLGLNIHVPLKASA